MNIAYNVNDFARVAVGVGTENDNSFTVSTVGAGLKVLVPNWSLTPILGINVSNTASGSTGAPGSIRGFNPGGTRAYATGGMDWQTGIGINLAAGYAQSLRSGEDGSIFFNAGFFL